MNKFVIEHAKRVQAEAHKRLLNRSKRAVEVTKAAKAA